jgi:hypothetical protein
VVKHDCVAVTIAAQQRTQSRVIFANSVTTLTGRRALTRVGVSDYVIGTLACICADTWRMEASDSNEDDGK